MNKQELDAVISDALNDAELRAEEIPAIDLYVDQIINLVADKQKEGSPRFLEKQLTKTMINNYSKDGVITPVKGKKYTKEQILQILTIFSLKSTLSIGEIKRILGGAYSIEGFDAKALEEMYSRYMQIKEDNREYAKAIIDVMLDGHGLDIERDEDFLAALVGIVSMSSLLENVAHAMIDARYPEPKEPDPEEKEKEKEKERELERERERAEKEQKEKAREEEKERERAEREREREEREKKKRERDLEKQAEKEKKKAKVPAEA